MTINQIEQYFRTYFLSLFGLPSNNIIFLMFFKVILSLFVLVIALAAENSMMRVIDNQELRKRQKHPKLRLTSFSPKDRNLDIYRRLIVAEPFEACAPISSKGFETKEFFVLANGPGCSYRQKAYNAMMAGAIGIIIIDDDNNRREEPYAMFVDGQLISFLIDESEGMLVQQFMKTENLSSVQVNVVYKKQPRNTTEVELWVSAIDPASYELLRDWNLTLNEIPALANKVIWKPRYVITGCINNSLDPSRNCSPSVASMKSCACGGEFCSPSEMSTTSNAIVMEDIRQKEIFKRYPDKYMAYVGGIQDKCLEKYKRDKNIDICSERVAEQIGLNITVVNEKVQEAARQCKSTLYNDISTDKYMYTHVNQYPSFTIEKKIERVRDRSAMKNLVCGRLGIDKEQGCTPEFIPPPSSHWYFYTFLIFGIALSAFCVFLCYRRMMRREMKKEISMQVSTAIEHYYSMNESKD